MHVRYILLISISVGAAAIIMNKLAGCALFSLSAIFMLRHLFLGRHLFDLALTLLNSRFKQAGSPQVTSVTPAKAVNSRVIVDDLFNAACSAKLLLGKQIYQHEGRYWRSVQLETSWEIFMCVKLQP